MASAATAVASAPPQPQPQADPANAADLQEIQSIFAAHHITQYRVDNIIGKGSYGMVYQAVDGSTGQSVAIKRLLPFIFKEGYLLMRCLRELSLLAHFRNHPNIVRLIDVFRLPGNTESGPPAPDMIFIVMELAEWDLKKLMCSGQSLSEAHVRFFIYQILCALHHIHMAGVIHRDLTPVNVLINRNCDVKLCDFGLATSERGDKTDYVCMRWYRAPELVLENTHYDGQVDVWGCGAVMAQFFNRRYEPVFPGRSSLDQLSAILDIIGRPPEEDLLWMCSTSARRYIRKLQVHKDAGNFRRKFKAPEGTPLSDLAIDLLRRMLTFNPKKRFSVIQCMRHEYFHGLYSPEDEGTFFQTAFYEDINPQLYDLENPAVVSKLLFTKIDSLHQALGSPVVAIPNVNVFIEGFNQLTLSTCLSTATAGSGCPSCHEDQQPNTEEVANGGQCTQKATAVFTPDAKNKNVPVVVAVGLSNGASRS